jgi:hypothetical protein
MDNRTSTNLYVVMCHLHRVWGIGNCSLIYNDDDDDDDNSDVNDDHVNLPHKNINAQKQKHLI